MLYKVRSILDECVNHREDVETIGRYLTNKVFSLTPLSMFEIYSLWECYSNDTCAQFLHVNDKSLDDFWHWLND